jgi:hypothetical protein
MDRTWINEETLLPITRFVGVGQDDFGRMAGLDRLRRFQLDSGARMQR